MGHWGSERSLGPEPGPMLRMEGDTMMTPPSHYVAGHQSVDIMTHVAPKVSATQEHPSILFRCRSWSGMCRGYFCRADPVISYVEMVTLVSTG